MSKALDMLQHLLTQMEHTVVHYAPAAWQLLCTIKRVDSIGDIVIAVLLLAYTVSLALASKRIILGIIYCGAQYNKAPICEEGGWQAAYHLSIMGYVIGVALAIIAFTVALGYLLNVWEWVGVFNPGLAIAHDLYVKATAQ